MYSMHAFNHSDDRSRDHPWAGIVDLPVREGLGILHVQYVYVESRMDADSATPQRRSTLHVHVESLHVALKRLSAVVDLEDFNLGSTGL